MVQIFNNHIRNYFKQWVDQIGINEFNDIDNKIKNEFIKTFNHNNNNNVDYEHNEFIQYFIEQLSRYNPLFI